MSAIDPVYNFRFSKRTDTKDGLSFGSYYETVWSKMIQMKLKYLVFNLV